MRVVRRRIVLAMTVIAALSAPRADAQNAGSATDARDLLGRLFVSPLGPGESAQRFQQRRDEFVDALGNSVANAIATTTLGGSSAGFTYVVDRATGERTLKTASFGPLFLDRPATTGAGQFNLGVNYNHLSFDKFQGTDLRDTGLLIFDNRVLYTRDNFTQFNEIYVTLKPDASVFTVYGTYGITDHVDIGVVMPIAHLSLKGERYLRWDISKTYPISADDRLAVPAPKGDHLTQDSGDISATGIGDITVRGKVSFGPGSEGAAVIGAVRFPSGDADNLLGTGKTAGGLKLVASKMVGTRSTVYGNGGYLFGGLSDEFGYGAGVDYVMLANKSLTVSGELLGQNFRDSVNGIGSDTLGPTNLSDTRFTPPEPAVYTANRPFYPPGSVNVVSAAVGAKLRVGGSALVSGGALFPLTDDGLHESVRIFVGLDFTLSGRR